MLKSLHLQTGDFHAIGVLYPDTRLGISTLPSRPNAIELADHKKIAGVRHYCRIIARLNDGAIFAIGGNGNLFFMAPAGAFVQPESPLERFSSFQQDAV